MNPVSSTNQNANKPRDDSQVKSNIKPLMPAISQKPKTANNNAEVLPKRSLSDRLRVHPNIPPLMGSHNNFSIPSKTSEVLSPLSPGQVLAEGKTLQLPQPPISLPVRIYVYCSYIIFN